MHIYFGIGAAGLLLAFLIGLGVGNAVAWRRFFRQIKKLGAWQRREQKCAALRGTATDIKRKLLPWRKD